MNPYLPLDTYIPDGEPHLFHHRLYIYGSHDAFAGEHYCPLDYQVYSCDIQQLSNFQAHPTSFHKQDDPANQDGKHFLYAPDVVLGNDGKYYLYYFLESIDAICVAVSDQPEGPFQYYGKVQYCVDRESLPAYPSNFDPAVINDDGRIYLAWGFSVDFPIEGMNLTPQNTKGAFIVELNPDMLTMKTAPCYIIPGCQQGKGTSFENHEFLEASSIRKFNQHYYFIYSSIHQHELCYAMADHILGPYTYQGVLISNAYEDNKLLNNWANNHGSIEKIGNDYYIFYHRHTCGTQFSRQGCVEKIEYDGIFFHQAKVTSQGFQGKLPAGHYPAGYACFVHDQNEGRFYGFEPNGIDVARIEKEVITHITDSTIIFRYFEKVNQLTLFLEPAVEGTVSIFANNQLMETKPLQPQLSTAFIAEDCEIKLQFHCLKPATLYSIQVQ